MFGDIHDKRELVNELVLSPFISGAEATELVDHETCDNFADPDIAVDDPYYVSFCFSVSSAHIPDLWVRSQVFFLAILTCEVWVFFFNENMGLEGWKVGEEALEN